MNIKGVVLIVAKVRQDAWTHEDDLLLAETVLRHIREGSTQLNAFEEVGDALNRTSAACGFRWNAEVRNRYVQAIELAKRQRKEKKRREAREKKQAQTKQQQTSTNKQLVLEEDLNLGKVISYLQTLQYESQHGDRYKQEVETLTAENERLKETNKELEKELKKIKERLQTVEEDYSAFIQIIERARKLTLLDDEETIKAPAFRMDKNGNLEQLGHN